MKKLKGTYLSREQWQRPPSKGLEFGHWTQRRVVMGGETASPFAEGSSWCWTIEPFPLSPERSTELSRDCYQCLSPGLTAVAGPSPRNSICPMQLLMKELPARPSFSFLRLSAPDSPSYKEVSQNRSAALPIAPSSPSPKPPCSAVWNQWGDFKTRGKG